MDLVLSILSTAVAKFGQSRDTPFKAGARPALDGLKSDLETKKIRRSSVCAYLFPFSDSKRGCS
jgi:hypothetical protein